MSVHMARLRLGSCPNRRAGFVRWRYAQVPWNALSNTDPEKKIESVPQIPPETEAGGSRTQTCHRATAGVSWMNEVGTFPTSAGTTVPRRSGIGSCNSYQRMGIMGYNHGTNGQCGRKVASGW